ncbi:MAG: hypothetical protein Q4G61_02255 [Tissierellia bacterium]|nr:hypothetical protein [Tissierellia bacterium]
MKRLLFSPVGTTDPISTNNGYDGALLHILRNYKPDMVVLYLSSEMVELHHQDNRFLRAIELLREQINIEFRVEVIERKELIDVQKFDVFYREFNEILNKLRGEYPDTEILLNVSSGTPAMKSTLQTISVLAPYKLTPVQVNSPAQKSNRLDKSLNIEEFWPLNEDNQVNSKNRCEVSINRNLNYEIKKELIVAHIKSYDYGAALAVAETVREFTNPAVIEYLELMEHRLRLTSHEVYRIAKKYPGEDFYLVNDPEVLKIIEYFLLMDITVRNQKHLDFIRSISPLIFNLLVIALKKHGLDISNYCTRDRWDEELLTGDETGRKISKLMNLSISGRYSTIYSRHLIDIVAGWVSDKKLVDKLRSLRDIESEARNIAAHEIVSVTDQWIKSKSKHTSEEILRLFKSTIKGLNLNIRAEIWDAYDTINKKIIQLL